MLSLLGVSVQRIAGGRNNSTPVRVRQGSAEIKIETSLVARGMIHPPERRRVSESAEEALEEMIFEPFSLDKLMAARRRMTADLLARFDAKAMRLLLSLQDEPDFDTIGLEICCAASQD
ncbi:hypothetical protein [Rhizobium sp. BR 314]|uniref:hypothetical protein n=1 Tax=Rhizobium sp. BR 314 TaxID=3040013 RepID=UPI0039BF6E23